MKLLWTRSNNPVDWLIWLLTGQDCAHFAIVFKSPGGGVVFQFNLFGGGIEFDSQFLKSHKVIHEIDLNLSAEEEDELWDDWVDEFDGKGYNYLGALYLGLMTLRKRIFGIALPAVNRWSSPGKSFCDQAYQLLDGVPGLPEVDANQNGMMTPHDLWLKVAPK